MKKIVVAAAFAALVGVAGAASAHHSAAQFDFSRLTAYKGVVKEFEPINPHLRMIILVSGAKGPHEVEFEGHSLNNMYRDGYRKGMVKVGDTITVNCAPLKSGMEGGYVVSVVNAEGKFFGARSTRAIDAAQDAKTTAESR